MIGPRPAINRNALNTSSNALAQHHRDILTEFQKLAEAETVAA
jgi:hypothetical protein